MSLKIITSLFIAVCSCLLTGCVQPNGSPDNTANGALIGGASGAAFGAAIAHRNPAAGALIGGAAGLVTGTLIGHSMDEQNQVGRMPPPPTPATPIPQGQPLSLADIKAMKNAKVSDDIIINQINNTHSVYNLDANAIIDLKNSGVSEKVIAYMMNTSTNVVANQAPPPPQQEVVVTSPGPDYIWVDGEWVWSSGVWIWIGGRWMYPPHAHAIWVHARWEHGPSGWRHTPGHWR